MGRQRGSGGAFSKYISVVSMEEEGAMLLGSWAEQKCTWTGIGEGQEV